MKYRLGKNLGRKSLKYYIKSRGFTFDSLAYDLGYTTTGLQYLLTGRTKNPKREILTQLAKILEMYWAYDDDGLYFEEMQDDVEYTIKEPDPLYSLTEKQLEVLKEIEKLPDEKQKEIWEILNRIVKLRK